MHITCVTSQGTHYVNIGVGKESHFPDFLTLFVRLADGDEEILGGHGEGLLGGSHYPAEVLGQIRNPPPFRRRGRI